MRTLDVRKKPLVSRPASSLPRKNCSAGSFPRALGEITNIAAPKTARIPQFTQCTSKASLSKPTICLRLVDSPVVVVRELPVEALQLLRQPGFGVLPQMAHP